MPVYWRRQRLKARQLKQIALCHTHSYGPMTEVWIGKKHKGQIVVGKVCKSCTYIMTKEEWVKHRVKKLKSHKPITTQHIDLFWS